MKTNIASIPESDDSDVTQARDGFFYPPYTHSSFIPRFGRVTNLGGRYSPYINQSRAGSPPSSAKKWGSEIDYPSLLKHKDLAISSNAELFMRQNQPNVKKIKTSHF